MAAIQAVCLDFLSRYGRPAGDAQPVAWVAADTLNSPHPTCISSLAYMSQIDQDRGREYVPLTIIDRYAAPHRAYVADMEDTLNQIADAMGVERRNPERLIEACKQAANLQQRGTVEDCVLDALANLEHDNYERSHKGYENRQADVAMIRAALAAQKAGDGDALREAVKIAYGYLWHVNNEPGTPNQYAPERAAYKARIVLREQLTKDERGEGINVVRAAMRAGREE